MNNVTQIITLKGRAVNVFSYLKLLAEHRGNVTLGELAKEIKQCGNA